MVLTQGELEIVLLDPFFEKGKPLRGTIRLHLPKPTNARGLSVEMYLQWGEGPPPHHEKTALLKKQLAGGKTYQDSEEHPFELLIPKNVDYDAQPARGRASGWFLHAVLDVPMASDLNARIEVLPYRAEAREV